MKEQQDQKELKRKFNLLIGSSETICILAHLNPDGDAVGSGLAVYNYILAKDPAKNVKMYLEEPSEKFSYLAGYESIETENTVDKQYDLCIVCDCAAPDRIHQKFRKYLENAKYSFLADHHITNEGFCDVNFIVPEASSTSEIVFGLMDESLLDRKTAECIYTGIIHDTGVFKYSCTSPMTMNIAGKCMEFGFDFGKIIDDSFYSMNLRQKKLLGAVLTGIESVFDGRFVYGVLTRKQMKEFGVTDNKDTDGFIDNIRTLDGALGAGFFYELADGNYKCSLRSSTDMLNVAEIAAEFGGGGHMRASGCTLSKNIDEDIRKILSLVGKQLS